ncbi:hypothetical protein ACBY01_12160 [Sphingomonas sp. ac-8]|uniref:hypothetical protein n=1 Tax=Sphingomonas sp. ac-8 TaxID=3242977 RepID=UPI003A7FF753
MADPSSRTLLIRELLEQAMAIADETEAHYVAVRIAEALDALSDDTPYVPPLRSTRAH